MTEFQKHLYLILYPNEALVASELSPEEFGRHYAVGSPKHFSGKVIFAEIHLDFRNDYFQIEEYLKRTVSGMPGIPKKTKFIKSYRVLEHIDFTSILALYLVTVDGQVLKLERSSDFTRFQQPRRLRIYQEICPLQLLVASNLDPLQFGKYITIETESKGAPKIFFTQYKLDVEKLLSLRDVQSLTASPLPNINVSNLISAILELVNNPDKRTKTISLNEVFGQISYSQIQHGFWLAEPDHIIFFPMPSEEELEEKHYTWWKSVYRSD